jgi:hypothetical protein
MSEGEKQKRSGVNTAFRLGLLVSTHHEHHRASQSDPALLHALATLYTKPMIYTNMKPRML